MAFWCIDTNVFRHALEERLKRRHIARAAHPSVAAESRLG
jgi:hypothetical protein